MSGPDEQPGASLEVLRLRAAMLQNARRFFAARGLLEVTTPALNGTTVTDVHITSISCSLSARPGRPYYLHTSPEYRMKQLLAAHRQDIFQICPVYRDNELGTRHQAEFTMIEWYRQGLSMNDIIDETAQLIAAMAGAGEPAPMPCERLTYAELFERATGVDPLGTGASALADCARAQIGVDAKLERSLGDDPGAWLDFIYGQLVTPSLAGTGLVAVTHYPAAHAALARLDPGDSRVAERFEVFWGGLELANGYRELTDAAEQRERFARDRSARRARGMPDVAIDEALLAAVESGLPECCGVALGFDRVAMRAGGLASLYEAVSFPLT